MRFSNAHALTLLREKQPKSTNPAPWQQLVRHSMVIAGIHNVKLIFPIGPLFGFVSLILIAGGFLLILLTLLGGSINDSPVNKFYFLEADTSGIGSAAPRTRWTLWAACTVDANGKNTCPGAKPAYPLDPPRNFGTTQNVPPQFVGYVDTYILRKMRI